MQELYLAIQHETYVLTQQLCRAPRPSELAERMGVPEEAIIEASEAGPGLHCTSLDSPAAVDGTPLVDRLGTVDVALGRIDGTATVADGMRHLRPREQRILQLYYFDGLTQADIAQRVGLSQMQVSRLIRLSLRRLRRHAEERGWQTGDSPLHRTPPPGRATPAAPACAPAS